MLLRQFRARLRTDWPASGRMDPPRDVWARLGTDFVPHSHGPGTNNTRNHTPKHCTEYVSAKIHQSESNHARLIVAFL